MNYTKLTATQSENLLKKATARAAAKKATARSVAKKGENTTECIVIDGIKHEVINSEYNPANKTRRRVPRQARGSEVNAYGETMGRVRIRWILYAIGAPIAVPALLIKALVNMRFV